MPDPTTTPSVRVRVPATSANLGPGFDALGVALEWTADLTFELREPGAPSEDGAIAAIEGMAATAASRVYERVGRHASPIAVTYHGDLPVGRGLGMSAAARAAGLVAANHLLDGACPPDDLLDLAVELEGHGDNIAPALFGGIQVVVQPREGVLQHVQMTPPDDLRVALLIPEFSMPTEESRKRLPTHLTRAEAVHNIGRAALVVAALAERRYANDAGAYGSYLSGGGSTVAAFVSPQAAEAVAFAMLRTAQQHGLEATSRVVALRAAGTEVVES